MAYGLIYAHQNRVNGKIYVGQTTSTLEGRWRLHLRCARSPKTPNHNGLFAKAIQKYGSAAFDSQVLSVAASQEELDNLERLWIILLQSKAPNGYNLTDGGNSGTKGHIVSDAVRKRLSEAAKAQWRNPEFLAKVEAGLYRGRIQSPEEIEKRAAAHRGHKNPKAVAAMNAARRGTRHSEETKLKIRMARLGKPWTDAQRAGRERGRNNA